MKNIKKESVMTDGEIVILTNTATSTVTTF